MILLLFVCNDGINYYIVYHHSTLMYNIKRTSVAFERCDVTPTMTTSSATVDRALKWRFISRRLSVLKFYFIKSMITVQQDFRRDYKKFFHVRNKFIFSG
jgi:hypothetical protein